ncbi:K+/H+ antiporter subunit F [Corticibacter populi]|uniref:K+/H+ antiporter subunit F n=1 Tax=Corticibacter populi TaxID=1550736 RepID=A0A3M6QYE6_9BURK|nr:K+/H+ antiporter subunit F [Corticibacter populi]RMX08040.1 K+/H+ antiporter subunit F [Corticibacter populi]RZS35285.1 multisubunit potassium/proton antiporter PhaF subunit [Corticibacter populi]
MSGQILAWALPISLAMLALAMLMATLRLLIGPSAQDRVMALDCIYALSMFVMLTLSIYYDSGAYFEAALLIALLGFVSTTAMAKFLLRGEVIE